MPLDLVLAECETRHGELLVYHVIITVGHTASRGHIETIRGSLPASRTRNVNC